MAGFNVTVTDIATREHVIAEKCASPLRREPFYHYLPDRVDLPVIHVEISLPIYRMANWRTRIKQLDYIHREGLQHEYFQTGEEDIGPQRVQHQFLIEFAKRGRGETIIPVMQKLRQDRRQMESLLVTSTGVVVNGNRRLAAMRELFAEDPGNFPFHSIEVAVLSAGLTDPELKKIEFQLQMQQETKLPYEWAIQCLSVRELAQSGISHEEIKYMMRLGPREEIQPMITRLNEAELYLADYLGTPENYSAIERQEQQFNELQKALDRKTDVGEKELARRLCYPITKHSRDLETRVYDFKIAFGRDSKEVAERLAERMGIELLEPAADDPETDEDDIFADDAETDTASRFAPLAQLLIDPDRSGDLAEAIADICTEIKEESRDQADSRKPLRHVKRARQALSAVEIQRADDSTLDDIRSELGKLIELAQSLLNQIDERE
jgi:hypothetical protein